MIGAPERALNRVLERLNGLRVGDKHVIYSIDAFGSRAGSVFRGRGPLPSSDLDLLIGTDYSLMTGRNGPWINKVMEGIRSDFYNEVGFSLSLHMPQLGTSVIHQQIGDGVIINLLGR